MIQYIHYNRSPSEIGQLSESDFRAEITEVLRTHERYRDCRLVLTFEEVGWSGVWLLVDNGRVDDSGALWEVAEEFDRWARQLLAKFPCGVPELPSPPFAPF